ncbi:MAG TPA: ABC transporter ATP-binding protein [Dissulfurispiraceae bacterium]|nr:ABC transporter ATP-binding protein [Dissulfurispiraceae bacterium]
MSLLANPAILEAKGICFSYGKDSDFIEDLSFSMGEGEFIGLLGANGSGKSTMLKLCSGILKPKSGELTLWGKPFRSYKDRDRAKLISYLPQALDFSIPFNVRELVGMGIYPYDIPPLISTDDALDMVGLGHRGDSHLSDLSGGERRRAFIAMTLLQGAGLLLLDEPLANLDIKYQLDLVKLLRRLRDERNISVVMALHDINVALRFEKVMVIKGGRTLGIGKPAAVLTRQVITEAFDVMVEIKNSGERDAYISFEENY